MFSTCLVCHRNLGANEAIESFPVGRRLAFDERTGRLWVVCKRCGHWNLSPLEERWEAIEACERAFREARIKASTDNIGLTTLREGLDLVRIGKPLRPEFSAWRYGPRLIARRKKAAVVSIATAAAVGVGSVAAIGASIGIGALLFYSGTGLLIANMAAEPIKQLAAKVLDHGEYERTIMTVSGPSDRTYLLRKKHLRLVSFERDRGADGWHLSLHHDRGVVDLKGIHATLAAGKVLARMNSHGASKAVVNEAALRISDAGDPQQFIRNAISLREQRRKGGRLLHDDSLDTFGLLREERLALEMAMHEDSERVAMEGELAALEEAWRQAEEIGRIADRMFDR